MMNAPFLLLLLHLFSPCITRRLCNNLDVRLADFGIRLLRTSNDDTSVIISPASAAIALAMVYAGANNDTKQEINSALGEGCDDDTILNYYADIMNRMSSPSAHYVLRSANRIHLKKSVVLQDAFIETMRTKFNGEIRMMDFQKAEETAKAINEWLKEETNGKIEKVIDEGDLNLSDLFLINVIFFNGSWEFPFKPQSTLKEKFYPKEGKRKFIDTMRQIEVFPFAEDDLLKVIALPYKNEEASLYVFLPKRRFAIRQMENSLNGSKLLALVKACRKSGRTEVRLPKLEIKIDFAMKKALRTMGIRRAFSRTEADFSGICTKPIHIGNFIHKAFIEVNEGGTDASAVSAVNMVFKSARPIKHTFIANHPFMFALFKNETMLFVGHFFK